MATKPLLFLRPVISAFLFVFLTPLSQAADLNGYTAEYECRSGGPQCNVDVGTYAARACDQTITTGTSWGSVNWNADSNGDGHIVICLQNGDHVSKGTLTIPASANGTAGNYRVLRYTRASDTNDNPWNQASPAKVSKLEISADYWIIDRLMFPGIAGSNPPVRLETVANGGDVHDVILNRVLVEGLSNSSNYYGFSQACDGARSGVYHDLTVQNSVFRKVGPWAPNVEAIAIDLQCGDSLRAVNNEVYDWVSHAVQLGHNPPHPTLAGIVVENNDFYVTNALYTNGGATAATESALSVKMVATIESPARILHNRIWGTRLTDTNICCNGEPGDGITSYDENNFLLFKDNIVFDAQIGINNVADNNSFVGNLFWKIKQYEPTIDSLGINSWFSTDGAARYEIYLNTFVDVPQYTLSGLDHDNVDVRCNVAIASGQRYPTTPPSSSVADNNVFYGATKFTFNGSDNNIDKAIVARAGSTAYAAGDILRTGVIGSCVNESDSACFLYKVIQPGTTAATPANYCTTLGCTTTDNTVTVQAIRGPFKFYRKLQTGAEVQIVPYTSVHSSAQEAGWCPPGMAALTNIGINDDASGVGIFAADMKGSARAGTAGAVEVGSGGSSPSGLIARWPLDDGSGTTAADASGNGHSGTLVNGPTWNTNGHFGGALGFDGVDDYVSISAPVIGNQAAFTLTAWVKISSAQKGVLYSEESTTSTNPFVYISVNENATGDAEFGIRDDAGTWAGISAAASNLNDGQWHLLVGVQRNKTDRELFIDGVSVGQSNVAIGTASVSKADMGKFDLSSTGNRLQGALDDVRIYNRALTATEIQALFNGS